MWKFILYWVEYVRNWSLEFQVEDFHSSDIKVLGEFGLFRQTLQRYWLEKPSDLERNLLIISH